MLPMNQIRVRGYYGDDRTKALEGEITLTVSGSGMHENLQISFVGKYQMMFSARTLEQIAAQTRTAASGQGKGVEYAGRIEAYYSKGHIRLRRGVAEIWFRVDKGFEMLSVEYGGQGQISLPYDAVRSLLRAARQNLV